MAGFPFRAFDRLDLLPVDSFLFLSNEDNGPADRGRDDRPDDAAVQAVLEAVFGLEIASLAPDDAALEALGANGPTIAAPAAAGGAGVETGIGGSAGITLLHPQFFDAKGGIPGPPSGAGGGGEEDGGDSGGGGVLTDYFSGSADGADNYDIWIEFKGGDWTVELQQAFIAAADYFTTVITADIGGGGRYRGKIIDDLYVSAELKAIDGSGGVLGQAGPTAVWTAKDLTAAGVMEFDIADAQDFYNLGLWDDIVTHELMHVLGFGTLWEYNRDNLVDGYQYVGAAGLAAFNKVDPTATYIPVEEDGGSGTAGGHWDEEVLDNELMTGWINNDNYLSEFSVMSLADLGYAVEYQEYQDSLLVA